MGLFNSVYSTWKPGRDQPDIPTCPSLSSLQSAYFTIHLLYIVKLKFGSIQCLSSPVQSVLMLALILVHHVTMCPPSHFDAN